MKNSNIEVWEKIFQENEWGKYPSTPVIRFIARNFYKAPDRKKIKVLEIGSGTGANLWFCAREGFSVIGLEGSETAIDRMKNRFEDEKLTNFLLDTKSGETLDSESLYCNPFDRARQIIEKSFKKLKVGGGNDVSYIC